MPIEGVELSNFYRTVTNSIFGHLRDKSGHIRPLGNMLLQKISHAKQPTVNMQKSKLYASPLVVCTLTSRATPLVMRTYRTWNRYRYGSGSISLPTWRTTQWAEVEQWERKSCRYLDFVLSLIGRLRPTGMFVAQGRRLDQVSPFCLVPTSPTWLVSLKSMENCIHNTNFMWDAVHNIILL